MSEEARRMFRGGEVLAETYEVGELLGEGGMGQVFAATDTNLRRRVAIKANWPEATRTVRAEAQALAAIRHPGVVAVHALCTHRGVDFLVMEHVAGVTLSKHLEYVERAGAPLSERLEILRAVADALAAVHRAGLSHGDVKPSNVILAPSGRVVLLDLGLVRPHYEGGGKRVSGTASYMAPEIVLGAVGTGGWPLVDAYAFGVLAYRVLSGALPFEARSDLEMILAHANREPAPLAKESGGERLPSRLVDLVMGLLAKDPVDRPQPMDAVVWQLRAAQNELAQRARRVAATPSPAPSSSSEVAPRSVAPAPPASTAPARPLDVVVVDDDEAIGKLVGMYVRHVAPTATVRLASDGDAALALFRESRPDLVFLDLMMPRMSGFELFTYLRGVNLVDASRVVAMSAGGTVDDIQLILELGAQDFIPKDAQLRDRVQSVVRTLLR